MIIIFCPSCSFQHPRRCSQRRFSCLWEGRNNTIFFLGWGKKHQRNPNKSNSRAKDPTPTIIISYAWDGAGGCTKRHTRQCAKMIKLADWAGERKRHKGLLTWFGYDYKSTPNSGAKCQTDSAFTVACRPCCCCCSAAAAVITITSTVFFIKKKC